MVGMACWKSRKPETHPGHCSLEPRSHPPQNGRWWWFAPRVAKRVLRAMGQASLREALCTAGGEPSHPPGAPLSHPPPPQCLCGVTAARDLALICPFITLNTIRGSLEGWGRGQMENRERKQRACSKEAKRQGCVLTLLGPGQRVPPAPGLDCPWGCWRPAPPLQRLALGLTQGHRSLGGPGEAMFLVSIR